MGYSTTFYRYNFSSPNNTPISNSGVIKTDFHFLLHAQKKTKQKKKAPQIKLILHAKRTSQPFMLAYTHPSNNPRYLWTGHYTIEMNNSICLFSPC